MRKIKIYQRDNIIQEILDDSQEPLDQYMTKISSLLNSNNIMILRTTHSNLIIRPHRINSIEILDIPEINTEGNILDGKRKKRKLKTNNPEIENVIQEINNIEDYVSDEEIK